MDLINNVVQDDNAPSENADNQPKDKMNNENYTIQVDNCTL